MLRSNRITATVRLRTSSTIVIQTLFWYPNLKSKRIITMKTGLNCALTSHRLQRLVCAVVLTLVAAPVLAEDATDVTAKVEIGRAHV